MGTNTRIALAVALGYLLGRQHKLGTALAFGAAAAAGRMSQDPGAALRRGGELLGKSPVLGQLTELSKPLTAAGKAAATGAVSKGIDSVGDRIRRRADALRGPGEQAEPEKPEPEQPAAPEAEEEPTDRREAEGREKERAGRGEAEVADEEAAAADEEAEAADEYDEEEGEEEEEEEEPEQDEETQAPVARRRPSESSGDRSASAAGPRRKPAQDDLDEGVRRRVRRPDRERASAGGAPVRRRESKP